jgi:ATP-dependent Lon protease
LDEVPKEVRDELEVVLVDDMSQVLEAALEKDATDEGPTILGNRDLTKSSSATTQAV